MDRTLALIPRQFQNIGTLSNYAVDSWCKFSTVYLVFAKMLFEQIVYIFCINVSDYILPLSEDGLLNTIINID